MKKYIQTNLHPKEAFKQFQFSYIKTLSKRDIKTTTIFCYSKSHQNKHGEAAPVFHRNDMKKKLEQPRFFIHRKSIRKKSKWHRAFAHWSFIRESTSRRWCFFVHRICVEQSMPKRYELNMSKWHRFFAHQNYVEENTPKQRQIFSHWNHIRKVCQNDV